MTEDVSDQSHPTDKSFLMKLVINSIKKKWPQVHNIETCDLHKLINHMDGCGRGTCDEASVENSIDIPDQLVILDTRPDEEYTVSHLKNSKRVHPEATDVKDTLTFLKQLSGEVTVVCYCSIGYRSSLYTHTLNKELDKDQQLQSRVSLFNLEGSIFKWANERRPMVNSRDQPTKYAHPYNFVWGKSLSKELRRSSPEI